jgi:Protein of unknown function (DUF2785)
MVKTGKSSGGASVRKRVCWSKLAQVFAMTAILGTFATAANAQVAHGKEYWKKIAANHYGVPEGQKAFALAKELGGYLKSTDAELRDDLAYSILATWVLRPDVLNGDELLRLEEEWRGNLKTGIGESGTDSIFLRSFSALCLSAIAERELKTPFLGEERYRKLLEATLQYLKEERDLRGFDARKGWIHATAHAADLLGALVRHPSFTEQDQANVLKALEQRLETAHVIFSFGEQDRLANALAAMAGRQDFVAAGFEAWIFRMDKADQAIWKDSPPQMEGLQRFENDSYLLSAFVARVSQSEVSAAAEEAKKAALKSLRRR